MKPVTVYLLSGSLFISGMIVATAIASVMMNSAYAEISFLNQKHKLEKEELQIKMRAYQLAPKASNQDCKE